MEATDKLNKQGERFFQGKDRVRSLPAYNDWHLSDDKSI